MAQHYTAVVSIHRTTERPVQTTTHNSYRHPAEKTTESVDRSSEEVVKLVVRARTLDKLREKLAAHVLLIEEDEA